MIVNRLIFLMNVIDVTHLIVSRIYLYFVNPPKGVQRLKNYLNWVSRDVERNVSNFQPGDVA
jgi:hypothetical protein